MNTPYDRPRPRWAPKLHSDAECWYIRDTQVARYTERDDDGENPREVVRIGDGSSGNIFYEDDREPLMDALHAAFRIPRCEYHHRLPDAA